MNYQELKQIKDFDFPPLDTLEQELEARLDVIDNAIEFQFNDGAMGSHSIYGTRHIITIHSEIAEEVDLVHELLHLKLHIDGYPRIVSYNKTENETLIWIISAWLGNCIKHPLIAKEQQDMGLNIGASTHRQGLEVLRIFDDRDELRIMDVNFGALMITEFYLRQTKSMFTNLVKRISGLRPDMMEMAETIIGILAYDNNWSPAVLAEKSAQIIEKMGMSKILAVECINGDIYYNDDNALPPDWRPE
jgi:hypothetical protein